MKQNVFIGSILIVKLIPTLLIVIEKRHVVVVVIITIVITIIIVIVKQNIFSQLILMEQEIVSPVTLIS